MGTYSMRYRDLIYCLGSIRFSCFAVAIAVISSSGLMVLEGSRSSEEIQRFQTQTPEKKKKKLNMMMVAVKERRQTYMREEHTKYSFEHVKNSNVSSLFCTFYRTNLLSFSFNSTQFGVHLFMNA